MALRSFQHIAASSLENAAELAAACADRAVFVAGGTDVLGVLKDAIHPSHPSLLIDLKRIAAMREIKPERGGLRIGALATLDSLARNRTVRDRYPLLAQAARAVASPQIRNMGTVGGNLCQAPRCWYYRAPENTFNCLRKGGERCNAVLGDNRCHSIFGAARTSQPGCAASCPANVAIPVYLEHIRRGRIDEAARLVLERNPLPAVTGRVCPHFCERSCSRSLLDEAVSTRSVERFLGDHALDRAAQFYSPPRRRTGKRIAVVGAGPGGLTAAYYLRLAGHEVTVFDDHPEAGGMLRFGIPAYRLPADVLRRQVGAFEGMGIRFELGVTVGRGRVSIRSLRRDFHMVFLATGTWRERKLGIEDEELLTPGLSFLIDIRRGTPQPVGKRVLVIGGGSVAVDVAVSARRLGAAEVTMACLEARQGMPAFAEDLELAVEEGIRILPSWGPHRVLRTDGRLQGMELVRCTSVFDADRRFRPSFDPATVTTVEADQVLVAIGQAADIGYAPAALKTPRGLLAADRETQATPLSRVFAGGDAVNGVGTVVDAISAGRRAAEAMDAAMGVPKARRPSAGHDRMTTGIEVNAAALSRSARLRSPLRAVSQRRVDREDSATVDLRAAETEAARCVNCGCVAVHCSDLAPALLALDAKIRTNRRTVPAEDFFAARSLSTTVLDADELVTGIVLPAPLPGGVQRYLKFRVRNSIDFPIVGVACVLGLEGRKVTHARVALGAVAPVPLRARAVEEFLFDKEISEETAELAGSLAVRGAMPLSCNNHKVQILKTLVTRSILGT